MMRAVMTLGLLGAASAQLSVVRPMIEAAQCSSALVVGGTISGSVSHGPQTALNLVD